MNKQLKIVATTLVMLLLFISVTYASGLEGKLTFTAENVYYEGTTIVIYGYWFNDTNKYIPYTNWVNMDVYAINRNFQELVASGQFTQRNYIYLEPGEAKYWTYRIHDSSVAPLRYWRVNTTVNYHWQNSNVDI
ncbi:hypothetical protein [Pelosinus sp. sgz500959]|uniref:hypothetical protein n=1 Tax=Pelosinus sp. sgz500959 TaxID=3242472 RepID=UPI00366B1AF3